jgi:phytoene dehydrogenase-like protein
MCLIINALMLDKPLFIKGGSIQIVNQLSDEITKHKGKIHYKHEVKEILIREKKAVGVKLHDGTEHYAGYVVSNANAYTTYNTLIKDKKVLPEELLGKINDYSPGPSIFQTYLGLPFDLRDYGFKASTSFFSPGTDIVAALSGKEHYPFVLTNYSLMDPQYSPPGKSSVVFVRFSDYKPWKIPDRKKYLEKKKSTQAAFIKLVKDITALPLEKAEVLFSGSPKTISHYSGNPFGSAIGADHTLEQSGNKRFHQMSPVPCLFLAGHDTKPAGGIGSTLGSGISAGNYLIKQG